MISVTYDHGGAVTGVTIHETTYSPAALVALAAEVVRLRAVVDAAITMRRLDREPMELFELGAWSVAERALYAAVDALTAAQEVNQ